MQVIHSSRPEVITQTEGIKYAGSKLKLLGDIIRTAQEAAR